MNNDSRMDSSRVIGVFDSGIGGLTVVSAIRQLLPAEQISYIGDTARVPYGGKSKTTVERYSLEITNLLLEQNAKLIVVACNTASALALPRLAENLPVPVVGVIEAGARAAIAATRNGHIGVIGTRATINSGAYEHALRKLNADIRVTSQACPLLVPLVEEGRFDGEVTERVVCEYVRPMLQTSVDTLVLGCTHYPLLRRTIQKICGDSVALIDSAENCARAVQSVLCERNIGATSGTAGSLHVALTDLPDHFLQVTQDALQLKIDELNVCELPQIGVSV